MTKKVLALGVLLLGMGLVSAQNGEWGDKLFAQGGTTHNFGSVAHGAVLNYRFPMTNIYAVPLHITGTRVSCGCVTVTPSKQVLQPRETGYVDVTMDARRFTGQKTVSIYITVGPQFTSTATLQVSAVSRPDVVFNPGHVNFGVVSLGQTPTQTIDVEYAGALEWKLNGIAEHKAPLDVKYSELYRRPGQVGYRLQVALKPDAPAGPFKHELLLQTNDPASLLVPLLAEGTIQAALSVVPPAVKLDGARPGVEALQRVFVNGNGGKLFRITGVDGLPNGLTADFASVPAPVQVLTLKWKPSGPGPLKADLKVKTDLDGGATALVTVEGAGPPAN